MIDVELFDEASFNTVKAVDVAITATTSGAPQTVVTMTTPSLPAGKYNIMYSWQATFAAKDRPLYFKTAGTFADDSFFSNAPGVNDALSMNRLYGFPKDHTGGSIILSLEMYDPLAEAVVDFCDVVVSRVG